MNHCIAGKPGDGKGLLSVRFAVHDLARGERTIITNLCIEKRPWVTGSHQPRRGLLDYLREKYRGRTLESEERIFRLQDKAMQNFFLYRGLSKKQVEHLGEKHLQGYRLVTPEDDVLHESEWQFHHDIKLYVADHKLLTTKSGKQSVESWDTRLAFASGGHLFNCDEAWSMWPARGWSNTSEGILYYCSMVRRFGDDCYFQSQRVNDVDKILMDRCQDFLVCKNHGRLRFGVFRQLPVFVVSVYDHAPTPSSEPSYRKPFQLDVKGLAECYDTSGGVGVTGKVMADIGRKHSGLPMWIIPVVGVFFIIAAIYGVKWGMGFIHGLIVGKNKPAIVAKAVQAAAPPVPVPVLVKSADDIPAPVYHCREPDLWCTGYTMFGGPQAFLSDGSTVEPPELTQITKHTVTVNGQVLKIRPLLSSSDYQPVEPSPSISAGPPMPATFDRPVNQADVTIIGERGGRRQPPPRLGGMASMQRSPAPMPGQSFNQGP